MEFVDGKETYVVWQWSEIEQTWEAISTHDSEAAANRRIYDWVLFREECKVTCSTETLH